ncbi:FadR/GntR family transcriptional regulator [Sphingomonas sp.]|uniref:FadR/GntR family transcriptional regulator n=1 Tax=Sphingomonas sp. TaxID=28214 RepID=UPI000DB5F97C|nr:FadR/GntR family transcriptional regulator [Sphingomonas sp.]PZU08795.1 MAG: GntR family transcriptional regulator [Sphingomonas sp.]
MAKEVSSPAGAGGKKTRIPGGIAKNLGMAIVSGQLSPGALLEGEIAASERLKVSRTAYREAVRILNAKGLVESRPKAGTRVSQPSSWHLLDPDVLAWVFEENPTHDVVLQIFELRRIVEPRIAALAAERRTPAGLEKMREALERMDRFKLTNVEGRRADQDFHAALIEAAGNLFLTSLSSGIGAAVTATTAYKSRWDRLRRDAVPDHRDVYEAIAASDVFGAHAAMKRLVDLACEEALI